MSVQTTELLNYKCLVFSYLNFLLCAKRLMLLLWTEKETKFSLTHMTNCVRTAFPIMSYLFACVEEKSRIDFHWFRMKELIIIVIITLLQLFLTPLLCFLQTRRCDNIIRF